MIVNCVVVTYNRLDLLKENLEALSKQTFSINKIIIVDNCSTDDTANYLAAFSNNPNYIIVRTEKNLGGAGGFSLGLKLSVLDGCDYTWLMDDDTIPYSDSLEQLIKPIALDDRIGFSCSLVNWIDGKPHIMNKPNLYTEKGSNIPMPITKGECTAYKCRTCSFVSVLISSQAVFEVGLPIKEFFIWCDDIEYTGRISEAGYTCYYTEQSIVLHKTSSNYYPSIDQAPANAAWRFYYQARNTCYLKHRKQPVKLFFYISVFNKYRLYKHKLKRRKDGNTEEFMDAIKRGCLDGLKFYPEIEFIKKNNDNKK